MSFMRGDLFTRTRKLVKGLAMAEPVWFKAMQENPPVVFPRTSGEVKAITLPEDVFVKKFFKIHPESLYEDPVRLGGFNPPPARVFSWRVLELTEQGVSEEEAMDVAFMEYRAEKKAKRQAYKRLKEIAKLQGTKPPPNPYPSAIREIQAEEKKYVSQRFHNPRWREILDKIRKEKAAEMRDREASWAQR